MWPFNRPRKVTAEQLLAGIAACRAEIAQHREAAQAHLRRIQQIRDAAGEDPLPSELEELLYARWWVATRHILYIKELCRVQTVTLRSYLNVRFGRTPKEG